jgi:hypothetical protein
MLRLVLILALSSFLFSCEEKVKVGKDTGVIQIIEGENHAALPEELEDCDDKIEKIKEAPVKIDLSNNGDEGCTIE